MSPSPQTPTVTTRILFLSDTHGAHPPLTPSDLLIHTGDLTSNGRQSHLEAQMRHLATSPAPLKLVIAGNHDITLDPAYYARKGHTHHGRGGPAAPLKAIAESTSSSSVWGDKISRKIGAVFGNGSGSGSGTNLEDVDACRALWNSQIARDNGVVYLDEGLTTHTLPNGAEFTVYASPYQPEYCDWAFAYQRNEDRFNTSPTLPGGKVVEGAVPVPDWPGVDIMMTHGPPMGVLDQTTGGNNVGCENLRRAVGRARPKLHAFGHIHEGWGVERVRFRDGKGDGEGEVVEEVGGTEDEVEGCLYVDLRGKGEEVWGKETLCVNSSIMNRRYRPVQRPILVDVELPLRREGMDE